jgi:hypothetical protein
MKKLAHVLAVLALLAPLTLVGTSCRRADLAYCDKSCDCTGCNAQQKIDCEDGVDDARKQAEQENCLPEYDKLVSCGNAEFECTNGQVTTDGCTAEYADLLQCLL